MLRLLAIAGLMTCLLPGAPAEDSGVITIVNSGSTNIPGFRIAIDGSGSAERTSKPRRFGPPREQPETVHQTIPRAMLQRFRADLNAAKPLSSLPAVHCAKSVSFGTRLTVSFGGDETPDLSCGDGGNTAMHNLIRDANEIVALFNSN